MRLLHRTAEERREAALMAELGLPDFETVTDCLTRNRALVRRLARARHPLRGPVIAKEDQLYQEGNSATDGCWIASRRFRARFIPQAHKLIQAQNKPIYFASVVHPRWILPLGDLAHINLDAIAQWAYRRLRKIDSPVIAVGSIEACLNVELDGSRHWAPHIHLLVTGADDAALGRALAIEKRYARPRYARPTDVRTERNLGQRLGYATKRIGKRRIAYIDNRGRQNRNGRPGLRPDEQLEFDSWLLGVPAGGRTLLFGCRLHRGRLRAIKHLMTPTVSKP